VIPRRLSTRLAIGAAVVPWLWFVVRDLSVVMEVVAVLLPPLVLLGVLALLAGAALTRNPAFVWSAASLTLLGVVAILLPWLPHPTGRPADGVTIAVANVLGGNRQPEAAARDLLALHADVLVVPENTPRVDKVLRQAYPFTHRAPHGTPWLGVYANIPVTKLAYPSDLSLATSRYARIEVGTPTPFVLWALHLPRPWLFPKGGYQLRPGGHARVLSDVIRHMEAERLPVVAAGDLNLTDRGRGYRKLTAHLDDAMSSIRGARSEIKPSFRPLLLNIDHILEPPSWCADQARRFRISGSDHRGIGARIGPCS
jgi:endonuclease/exonuclease/phosphatase (EEP) superfamily protein YafD